jgi:hypothetical protein
MASTQNRQCCSIELEEDYNCIENYFGASLWNYGHACKCYKLGNKYTKNTKNFYCNSIECGGLINYIMSPFALFADIICCPCRTFLYCEKCINTNDVNNDVNDDNVYNHVNNKNAKNKKKKQGVITIQPITSN